MKNMLRKLLNIIFPKSCLICQKPNTPICQTCLYKLPKSSNPYSLFKYQDNRVKKIIKHLKNHPDKDLTDILATHISDLIKEDISSFSQFKNIKHLIIIPTPQNKRTTRKRGFNQAYLIAKSLHKKLTNSHLDPNLIQRTGNYKKQSTIKDKQARKRNIKNTFKLKKPYDLTNTLILLVDDVTTTGATLNEQIKLIKTKNPEDIWPITIAH